jgi:microcystin-dependent protein
MRKIIIALLVVCISSNVPAQPPGTIIAYAGTIQSVEKLKDQWVICDGKLFSRTNPKYTKLFAAIGTSWGGDGGTNFAVPDLRGLFLRGVSGTSGVDPDAEVRLKSRTDLNSSGNGGNAVGSKQNSALQSHVHPASTDIGKVAREESGMGITSDRGTQVQLRNVNIRVSEQPNGATETRPSNAAVYYLIKL